MVHCRVTPPPWAPYLGSEERITGSGSHHITADIPTT